jgi:hypothetical protein
MSEDLETRVINILRPTIAALVKQIKEEAKNELIASLGAAPSSIPPSQPEDSAPQLRGLKSLPPSRKKQSSNRLFPPHCVYPQCANAHKGPRFSFMCPEHYGVPKKDKAKYLAAWKSSHSA